MKARHKDGRETDEITDEEFYRTYQPAGFVAVDEATPEDAEAPADDTGGAADSDSAEPTKAPKAAAKETKG